MIYFYFRYKVTGLTENLEYQFRVCAENLAGIGKFSRPSDAVVCRDSVKPPGKPVAVEVSRNEVKLEWQKPEYDGGFKLTGMKKIIISSMLSSQML